MTTRSIDKPLPEEYPAYSSIYMDLMKDDGKVLEHLWTNFLDLKKLVLDLTEDQLNYRYAEGKWTIKEILVHLIDDERIFAYRALRYARNDSTPLHGFDQDAYANCSNANARSLDDIFEEYETVRKATISLFLNLPEDSFLRGGAGIDYDGSIINRRTVRALAYHIAGHELRHINIIKERYLKKSL
ncbi:DinB family protein [Flagellimonas sp.]|uniref:DinB family protein n=1 Tax=Flagellimonas sp. TaxID=2058762 RepID=UPI003B5161B3